MTERIETGISGLDQVLQGGLIAGDCVLVEGGPGTGKTTLGMQFVVAGALRDQPGMIVTFEQLPWQLYRDAANFGWDLEQLSGAGKLEVMGIIPSAIMEGEPILVQRHARALGAKRVLIDSLNHLARLTEDPVELREMINRLVLGLKQEGITAILTKEGDYLPGGSIPFEEYTADVLISLSNQEQDGYHRARYLEVLKLRGGGYLPGKHLLRFGNRGVEVIPSLPVEPAAQPRPEQQRASTGVAGLDRMLAGGLIAGSVLLAAGSSGTGKTTLAIQFLERGAGQGERGLLVGMQEEPEQLLRMADGYQIGLRGQVEAGAISLLPLIPGELQMEEIMHELSAAVVSSGCRRLAVDGLTELRAARPGRMSLSEAIFRLTRLCQQRGITCLLTSEIAAPFGTFQLSQDSLSGAVDNLLLLRFVEAGGEVRKALSVLKTRGSDHDRVIREYTLGLGGMQVLDRFEGFQGLMEGIPRDVSAKIMETRLSVLNSWMFGLRKASRESLGDDRIAEQAERVAVEHWLFRVLGVEIPSLEDPLAACQLYVEVLDREGLMPHHLFMLEREEEGIRVVISGECIYAQACADCQAAGLPAHCLRAVPFLVAIRYATGREFRGELVSHSPGQACAIMLREIRR